MSERLVQMGKDRESDRLVNQRVDGTPIRDLFMEEGLLVVNHENIETAKNTMTYALGKATREEVESLKTLPMPEARALATKLVERQAAA